MAGRREQQSVSTSRSYIRFLLNDTEITLFDVSPEDMMLDFLRSKQRLTGSKEGCAEGDCGACTILVGRLERGELLYEPVNSCIRFLASLDNCHVVTIEHLKGSDERGKLHPIQQAMIEHHGSQCGFCTPGIVMALYALWMRSANPDEQQIEQALQGNLCRCTGYEPIMNAARSACTSQPWPRSDPLLDERQTIKDKLVNWQDGQEVVISSISETDPTQTKKLMIPANEAQLAQHYAQNPDAILIAGATDAALRVTKFLDQLPAVIHIGQLQELQRIEQTANGLTIGAGVSYAQAIPTLLAQFPHLTSYLMRIGGAQVRAMGTIGGNIANGSPIGDMPPVLIALGATIALKSQQDQRQMPLEDYFLGYGQQDRKPDEYLRAIFIPTQPATALHAAYKISKRRDEDISSVAMGIMLEVRETIIHTARIAFGGMAATPKRAQAAEKALLGQTFSEQTMIKASLLLQDDFTPLSDMRASQAYRMRVAQNLFRRFYHDHSTDRSGMEAAQ